MAKYRLNKYYYDELSQEIGNALKECNGYVEFKKNGSVWVKDKYDSQASDLESQIQHLVIEYCDASEKLTRRNSRMYLDHPAQFASNDGAPIIMYRPYRIDFWLNIKKDLMKNGIKMTIFPSYPNIVILQYLNS